ncbi:glomulin-like [Argiope bruennichi]|uniref:glomulin-like n=1 Tax=Argiope bruennichi TaxID=94029 RepID=UPI002494DC7D|nr:glomulin-like [Argiope bruennichi]
MKTETAFEVELERNLTERKFDTVLETLKNPENDTYIETNVWNIINTVCLTLKTKDLVENEDDVDICRKILLDLVDRGSAKEVIVALMEDADSFKNHFHFSLLLEPLKRTLLKVPGKRGKSLEWVLSTLNAHIQTLSLPEDNDLQGDERMLLDADPAVMDANYVLASYLKFINTFVEEVSFETLSKKEDYYVDRVEHQREILQKFILILFDRPFLYQDLHVELDSNRPKSTIRTLCESYVHCLFKTCSNVFNLFKYETSPSKSSLKNAFNNAFTKKDDETREDIDDSENVPSLAMANLSYLIFVENIALDFQPFVYNHRYLFMKNLRYITLLLEKNQNLVLFKGLHLAQTLLSRLEEYEIVYNYIELGVFTEFPRLLMNVAIFSPIDTHRKMAVQVFLSYIGKCDWKGRYHLINQVLCTTNHSGAEGLVINLYKTYLNELLNGSVTDNYLLGKNLKLFLKKVYVLKEGVETDILEHSDRIMTSLNFLRYLLIRDSKDKNITGVWDLLPDISKKFLEPLSTGLDLSRAHYKQVAKDNQENARNKAKGCINSTVTVNNEVLPNVPPEFQKDLFEKALLTFDMIESILFRVRELS